MNTADQVYSNTARGTMIPAWSRYYRIAGWFMHGIARNGWRSTCGLVALDVCGTASEAGAIALAIRHFEVPTGTVGPLELALAVGGLLFAAGLCRWIAGNLALRVGRALAIDCAQRASDALGNRKIPMVPFRPHESPATAARMTVHVTPLVVSRVANMFLRALAPLGMLVASIVIVATRSPMVALFFAGMMAIAIPALRTLSRRGATCVTLERHAVLAATRDWVSIWPQGDPRTAVPSINSVISSRDGQLSAILASGLVTSSVVAICLASVVGWLFADGSGSPSTTAIVALIVSLRAGLTSFRTIGTMLTSINRFYPQLNAFIAFLASPSAPLVPVFRRGLIEGISRPRRVLVRIPYPVDGCSMAWAVDRVIVNATAVQPVVAPATGSVVVGRDLVEMPANEADLFVLVCGIEDPIFEPDVDVMFVASRDGKVVVASPGKLAETVAIVAPIQPGARGDEFNPEDDLVME